MLSFGLRHVHWPLTLPRERLNYAVEKMGGPTHLGLCSSIPNAAWPEFATSEGPEAIPWVSI